MNIEELMQLFANPQHIFELSALDKLVCSLVVTIMGMGITYIVLILLRYACQGLSVFTQHIENRKNPAPITIAEDHKDTSATIGLQEEPEALNDAEDEVLVAVITAAVAAVMARPAASIRIHNISHIKDHSNSWSQIGRMEHMASRQ